MILYYYVNHYLDSREKLEPNLSVRQVLIKKSALDGQSKVEGG